MAQVSARPLDEETLLKIFQLFLTVLLSLDTQDKVKEFMYSFFTPTERIVLAKRLAIYLMIAKGCSYDIIIDKLKVSPPTVSAVSRAYRHENKCRKIIDKILSTEQESSKDNLFWQITEAITWLAGQSRKGGGSWRHINKQIKKHRQKPNVPPAL